MSDLISREDAVALVIKAIHGTDNKEIKEYLFDGLRKQMWSLPSAESTGAMDEAIQEYIKDGYMQPIGEDLISRQDALAEFRDGRDVYDIMESIEELPSAPDSQQRGEWVGCTGCEHYDQQQTRLICHDCRRYYSDKYKGGAE